MFFLLLSICCLNYFLISKYFSNTPLLFISIFILLLQPILVLIRFLLNPLPFFDPTMPFDITLDQSYSIMFIFSLFITFLIIPAVYIIKKMNITILNLNFSEIIHIVMENKLLVFLSCLFYPSWSFTLVFIGNSFIDTSVALGVRLFGSAWFFLPFFSKRFQSLPLFLFLVSLPISFSSGNRTSFIYPFILYLIGFICKLNASNINIFSIERYSIFKFNQKSLLLLLGSLFISLLFIMLSKLIRINRELQLEDIQQVYDLLSITGFNPILISILSTVERLILWQFISSSIVNPLIGFKDIFTEFYIVFSPFRHNWDYVLNNNTHIGLLNFIGFSQTEFYTWPVTTIVEGSIRFGYLGASIYYFMLLNNLVITTFLSKQLAINKLLLITYILNTLLINTNGDSLATTFKTSFQFIIVGLLYKLFISILPKRL